MRFQNWIFVAFIVTVGCVQVSQGFAFLGIFKPNKHKASSTTLAPREKILSPTNRTSSSGPEVPQNSNPKTCWWTQCESRCPGSAQIAGASQCEGQKGKHKFNCCRTVK